MIGTRSAVDGVADAHCATVVRRHTCNSLGTGPVALTTENHGVRGLAHYMSLEEAVAVKRISRENNRPYLLSDDMEVKNYRRVARSATMDAEAMRERIKDRRLNLSSRGLVPRRCKCQSEVHLPHAEDITTLHKSATSNVHSLLPEQPRRWEQLPQQLLLKILEHVADSTSDDDIRSPFVEEASDEPLPGNCKDVLSCSSVCKSWRKRICSSSELLAQLRFSIDEARPFASQHYSVAPHMLRFISCPPFPLLVRTAASNRNASACYALAALLDLQRKRTAALVYWREAAVAGFRRAQQRVEAYRAGHCDSVRDGHRETGRMTCELDLKVSAPDSVAGGALLDLGHILFGAHEKPPPLRRDPIQVTELVHEFAGLNKEGSSDVYSRTISTAG